LCVSIDEALAALGRRVSVRRVAGTRDGRPLFTDVVGVLAAADASSVVVRRADGTAESFLRESVVAAKIVPVRGLSLSGRELEEIAAAGWRGTEAEALGDWLLRYGQGFTGRANSVLLLGDPGVPLGAALAQVEAWYAERGLPPKFQVPVPDSATADAWLAAQAWTVYDPVRVLVADLADLLSAPRSIAPSLVVRVDDAPDEAWIAAYHYRGGPLPASARSVIENGDQLGFASVRSASVGPAGGGVLAIARGSVDRGWLGVTAVEVAPAARRQGLAGVVLSALAQWASGLGAHSCYLQVAVENEAALALYLGTGFVDHHRYHYRVPPSPMPAQ
jgi:N-acetylglutamate synthase